MSRKIERLINLTIALLAAKRYLTKSEVFRLVDGYEGTLETKERMFERDKDDLRSLGIIIDVGSYDPLFDDEQGYRITKESYQLDLGEITPIQLSLLSLAAQSWQGAALDQAAQSAILKLNSIGVFSETFELPGISPKLSNSSSEILIITLAIMNSSYLRFDYLASDLDQQERLVIPFSLASRQGFWYLACVDQAVMEIRIFRLDRFLGNVVLGSNNEEFETPTDFDFSKALQGMQTSQLAVIDVRKNRGKSLRELAISSRDLGEWDELVVPLIDTATLTTLVLWHGIDAFVKEPIQLRTNLINALERLIVNHE